MRKKSFVLMICLCLVFTFSKHWCNNNHKNENVTYEITGNIRVTNDCDGKLESIPNTVTVDTELISEDGNIAIPGFFEASLSPDPKNPNNPVKIGVYSITILWTDEHEKVAGPPTKWKRPLVKDSHNGNDICLKVNNCAFNKICYDTITGEKYVSVSKPPWPTIKDIEVLCVCR